MWKYFGAAALTVAFMIPALASAATLEKGTGVGCPDGEEGTFLFTNNKTGTTTPGFIRAWFDSGNDWTIPAYDVNKSVQHFYVNGFGRLMGATTSTTFAGGVELGGKLVLDHFWCTPK